VRDSDEIAPDGKPDAEEDGEVEEEELVWVAVAVAVCRRWRIVECRGRHGRLAVHRGLARARHAT
jgi:hypothetical protein